LRHVQRRVQLTLRLRRCETGAGLAAAAADDLPAPVLGLQGLGGERDHLARCRAGEDHVDTAGAGAHLQLCEQRLAVARARRREGGGIDDRQARSHIGEPAAEGDDERLEPAGQLLGDGPALGRLDGAQVVLDQQHLGEEVLPRGVLLELAHRLVADLQQLLAGERVLVLLDPLQQELLVLLLERARWPARGPGARLPREAQHGSTCTVTSCSRRSRLSRSSTWSAMACADSTSAWRSTHTVTSA